MYIAPQQTSQDVKTLTRFSFPSFLSVFSKLSSTANCFFSKYEQIYERRISVETLRKVQNIHRSGPRENPKCRSVYCRLQILKLYLETVHHHFNVSHLSYNLPSSTSQISVAQTVRQGDRPGDQYLLYHSRGD